MGVGGDSGMEFRDSRKGWKENTERARLLFIIFFTFI